MLEFMRKNTPHKNRIHELASALERQPNTIYEWERLGLDIYKPLSEIIRWRKERSLQNLPANNRGKLDQGLAKMIVERSGRAHTQQEIASYCGVSRVAVSQVENTSFASTEGFLRRKRHQTGGFCGGAGLGIQVIRRKSLWS